MLLELHCKHSKLSIPLSDFNHICLLQGLWVNSSHPVASHIPLLLLVWAPRKFDANAKGTDWSNFNSESQKGQSQNNGPAVPTGTIEIKCK